MKQVTNMSRLVNQLEKMFRELNKDFFDNALEMPVISVAPSSRSYAHYTPWDAWEAKDKQRREINIASGTLNRPLELITASLVHEMVHMYNDTVLNLQDTSRGGVYHNKLFAQACADHGLICTRTEKYGWSHTEPSDDLLEWVLLHDEFNEIELCRHDIGAVAVGIGAKSAESGTVRVVTAKGHSRRYVCPHCHTIVRATKAVNLICADCMTPMVEG